MKSFYEHFTIEELEQLADIVAETQEKISKLVDDKGFNGYVVDYPTTLDELGDESIKQANLRKFVERCKTLNE